MSVCVIVEGVVDRGCCGLKLSVVMCVCSRTGKGKEYDAEKRDIFGIILKHM